MNSPGAQPIWMPAPPPAPRPAPSPRRTEPLVSVAGVVAGVIVVGIVGVIVVRSIIRTPRCGGKLAVCCNNLKQLWTMQHNYMAHFGSRSKLMPSDTGSAFWVRLTKTSPPLIDASLGDIYDCPFSRAIGGPDNCEYWGPSEDVNAYRDGDPVGACDHGDDGIVVLRKSGDVMLYKRDDPVAISALARTRR